MAYIYGMIADTFIICSPHARGILYHQGLAARPLTYWESRVGINSVALWILDTRLSGLSIQRFYSRIAPCIHTITTC